MKIAVFSTKDYDREFFNREELSGLHDITFYEIRLGSDTVQLCEGFDAICVFVNDVVDQPILEKLNAYHIRLILLRCAGFNNVDLRAARENKIRIFRVPAYSPEAPAEHAVALIMTLNRKTHKAYNRIRENNFTLDRLIGFNLHHKTVGVIGTGKIGKAFCRIMLGFGCQILAHDKFPDKELEKTGIHYVSLEECLSGSDIISLHCPLTESTKHLIDEKTISLMKEGVMLINTSRGGLVNTKDVIHALKHQKIGYLGIDVYEQEESLFFEDHSETIIPDSTLTRLMTFPNVLITAHQGFLTREALSEIAYTVFRNIQVFQAGETSENEVKV